EASEVGNWQTTRPCRGVIVSMHATGVGAAAHLRSLHGETAFLRLVVGPGGIATEAPDRRPVRHCGRWGNCLQLRKVSGAEDDLASYHRQHGGRVGYFSFAAGEVVAIRNDEIGELTNLDTALVAFLIGKPRYILGPHPQRRLAIQAVALRRDPQTADGAAGDQPRQRDPWIV